MKKKKPSFRLPRFNSDNGDSGRSSSRGSDTRGTMAGRQPAPSDRTLLLKKNGGTNRDVERNGEPQVIF